jgi:hypothetical protein
MRAWWLLLLAGCSAASPDPGLDAELQVAGARFNPGAMPGDGSGPKVLNLDVSAFAVLPGATAQPLLGTLDATATAVAVQLAGDRGWWLLLAGVPDVNSPTLPTFMTQMSFARAIPPGAATLVVRAVDASGHFGPASTLALRILSAPISNARLTVTLNWANNVDLDLHVVEPSGFEIWSDAPQSPAGGAIDLDSNEQCVIDGHDREQIAWKTPPSGHYVVRVDTFSLCGQPSAGWKLSVSLDGTSLGLADGVSVDSDTLGPHQRGSGLTALEFDVPSS